jgi:hypothetical protein
MAVELRYLENATVECSLKDVHLSLWDILKYTLQHPYLKHYLIKDYEGGNTVVPRETWKYEENLVYKEIAPNVFYFPYESLGFVLNDSLVSLSLYAFEESFNDIPDFTKADLTIEIRDTDYVRLVFHESFLPLFLGFYTLSVLKIGFEDVTVTHLAEVIQSLVAKEKLSLWEPVKGSVGINAQGLQFLVETREDGEEVYYRFSYKTRCRKERLKPQEVKNIVLTFKKKILLTLEDKLFFAGGVVLLMWWVLLFVKKRFLMPMIVLGVFLWIGWILFKRFYLVFLARRGSLR